MKKLTAILIAVMMTAAMLAGAVTAAETDVTGIWYALSMEQDGIEMDAATLASMGMTITLTLNEDGTASLEMYGQAQEGTWTDSMIEFQDSPIPFEVVDGQLRIAQEGFSILFGREMPEALDTSLAPAVEHPEPGDFNGSWSAAVYIFFGMPLPVQMMGTDFSMDIQDGTVLFTETDYDLENNNEVTGTIEETFTAVLEDAGTLFVDFAGEEVLTKIGVTGSGIRLTLHEDGRISASIPELDETMEMLAALSADSESTEAEAEAADGADEEEGGSSSGEGSLSAYFILMPAE